MSPGTGSVPAGGVGCGCWAGLGVPTSARSSCGAGGPRRGAGTMMSSMARCLATGQRAGWAVVARGVLGEREAVLSLAPLCVPQISSSPGQGRTLGVPPSLPRGYQPSWMPVWPALSEPCRMTCGECWSVWASWRRWPPCRYALCRAGSCCAPPRAGRAAVPMPVWARPAGLALVPANRQPGAAQGTRRPRGLAMHPGRAEAGAALIRPGVRAGSCCPHHSHCPWGPSPAAPPRAPAGALSRLASPPSLPLTGTRGLEGGCPAPSAPQNPLLFCRGRQLGPTLASPLLCR